jgi:hypothetical protein
LLTAEARREKQRLYDRRRYIDRKANGVCRRCGRRPVAVGQSKVNCAECLARDSKVKLKSRKKTRDECYAAYGGYTCKCCGQVFPWYCMQLDHINNDGKAHRERLPRDSSAVYRDLKKRGYPPIVQPMCANCHAAKSRLGECPCKKLKQELLEKLYLPGLLVTF